MRRAPIKSLVGPLMGLALTLVIANVVAFVAWSAPRWQTKWGVPGVGAASAEDVRRRVEPELQRLRDTYGRLRRAEQDVAEFRAHMTSLVGGSDLLGMLNDAGDSVGITIEDASFQFDPVEELGVARLGITLPVSGTYEAVRRLLDELLELPVFLIIDGIGLQTADQTAGALPYGTTGGTVRIDLALSVFVEDPQLTAELASRSAPAARTVAGARESENLRRAALGNDAGAIADALIARLTVLPPLPVDADLLTVDMARLDTLPTIVAPSRNLFATVAPPAPPPVLEQSAQDPVVSEPPFPVRLVGFMFLKEERAWTASVTDTAGLQIFIVQAGDRLPNGVEVIDVGDGYVELKLNERRVRLTQEGNRQ